MHCSKEFRDWTNKMRKKYAKKNGVIPLMYFDDYIMEKEWNSSKKNYKRHKSKITWRRI